MIRLPQVRPKAWILGAAVLLLRQGAAAEESFDAYNWKPSSADARSYETLERDHHGAIDSGQTDVVVCGAAEELRKLPVWEPAAQAAREKLQRGLDATCLEFRGWFQTPLKDRTLELLRTGRFQLDPGVEEASYFHGTADEIRMGSLSKARGEEVSYRMNAMGRLMARFLKPMTKRMVEDVKLARQRWETALDQRYAQYPWEMLANSQWIGAPDIEHPPLRQWIVVHPELGVEISGDKFTEITAKEALTVEVLGHLWYRWRDEAKPAEGLSWLGLSGVLTFRSDVGTGIGIMGHWNKLVNAGVVWHDFNRDGRYFNDKMAFTVGIDLYRFAQREIPEKKKALEARLDETKKRWEGELEKLERPR